MTARRPGAAKATNLGASLGGVVAGGADGDVVPQRDGAGQLFVAMVHTTDEIRFVAASPRRVELVRQLAAYVRQCTPQALRTDDAAHVGALLAAGELEAAVTHYFSTVGQRWDEEWLVTTNVHAGAIADPMPMLLWPRACGTVYLPAVRAQRSAAAPSHGDRQGGAHHGNGSNSDGDRARRIATRRPEAGAEAGARRRA